MLLFNDLVLLIGGKERKWRDGGDTHGKKFISNLCDVLWYIDGHHEILEPRSCAIPTPLNTFTGYNTPEKSKHRKQQAGNLNVDVLLKHVDMLKESQITSWIQQSRWNELQESIHTLTAVLNDYCIYMKQKYKRAKARHECTVVPDSDSGSLCVLPTTTVASSRLTSLNDAIREKSCDDMLFVNDFCHCRP